MRQLLRLVERRRGRLEELDIPVRTHFYRGGHRHTFWQRELHRAYPLLMSAIGARPVS